MYFMEINYVFGKDEPHFVLWTMNPREGSKKNEWVFDKKIFDKNDSMKRSWVVRRLDLNDKRYTNDPKELIKKVFNYENQ